ncbi:MAG TPA: 2Fe-2S iron-sulfur cluster-binding protein [Pseudonocardiaceae bacterium]|nr:2Fe-2S iron-sulfur cluster-binding protein [Pseudonocardiaceae bacterium]
MTDPLVRVAGSPRIWAGSLSAGVTAILVVFVASGNGSSVSGAQIDLVVWWDVARVSGLIAWALLGATVLGGLLVTTRFARGRGRTWIREVHEFGGVLAVAFTVIHLVSVLADAQLQIGLRELFVPFTRQSNPVAQGCGVLAFYLLTAVVVTSWVRALLPWRWWRRLHLLAFPLFGLACAHSILAGSDTTRPVLHWASLVVGEVILFLVVFRLLALYRAGSSALTQTNLPTTKTLPSIPRLHAGNVSSSTTQTGMRLLISQTTWEADNVLSLRLRSPDGSPLPNWEPGAHIELALPSGRRRHYSLCGDPDDTRSYRIAVLQVPVGRGGSVEIHNETRAGQLITVHGPWNYFPLVPSSAYLFIAGGIGITAVLAMAARVASTDSVWKLIYIGRSRTSMGFLDEVCALGSDRVDVIPSDERGRADVDAIIDATAPGTAVYCCGPDRLMRAVEERVSHRSDLTLHIERFTGSAATGGAPFQVELRRTGQIIEVPADQTVLQAIRAVVPTITTGCEQGICGSCRTVVLAGEPDHRDDLLSNTERAAGAMLLCVSRSHSDRLVLDL